MNIRCICIISKDNKPLYFHSVTGSEFELRFTVHAALDVLDEKADAKDVSCFKGLLFLTEEFKVYGYIANTHLRFVLIIDNDDNFEIPDSAVRGVFNSIHKELTKLYLNPFFTDFDTTITSNNFQTKISELCSNPT
ncbi:hypothetical protein PCE1_001709 [Barthelona sp. PCE]